MVLRRLGMGLPTLSSAPTSRIRFAADDPNEQHEENFRLCVQLTRELLEQEKDDTGGPQHEREAGPVGEELE
jgi:hypothetical protein